MVISLILEGAMGKPGDELSDPELRVIRVRALGVLPWKKIETTLFKLA